MRLGASAPRGSRTINIAPFAGFALDARPAAVGLGDVFDSSLPDAPCCSSGVGGCPRVRDYTLSVNLRHTEPESPFMHGYVVGPPGEVACPVQFELEVLLRTVIE